MPEPLVLYLEINIYGSAVSKPNNWLICAVYRSLKSSKGGNL